MRKAKFLLTLAAAAAVMSTAAMSFAQWDTLTATAKGTVTLAKPVTITTADVTYNEDARALGSKPSYSADVTFTIPANDVLTGKTPQLEFATVVNNGNTPVTSDFDVVITKKDDTTNTAITGPVDANQAANEYTVTVTPRGESAPSYADGQTALTVEVTATLSAKATV